MGVHAFEISSYWLNLIIALLFKSLIYIEYMNIYISTSKLSAYKKLTVLLDCLQQCPFLWRTNKPNEKGHKRKQANKKSNYIVIASCERCLCYVFGCMIYVQTYYKSNIEIIETFSFITLLNVVLKVRLSGLCSL